MAYVIKHEDKPVMRFKVVENTAAPNVSITWTAEDKDMLLIDLPAGNDGLSHWLRGRTIPKNRAFANSFCPSAV